MWLKVVWLVVVSSAFVKCLCGFGVVDYRDMHLQFPKTRIQIPMPNPEIGTRWLTPDGLFDCTVFSTGYTSPGDLEVSCCEANASNNAPWTVDQRARLLKGLLQVYMEASLG